MTKKDRLYAYWSKRERDIMYCYSDSPSDGHLLHRFFDPKTWSVLYGECKPLYKELEARGYDITTFRFSIKKKVE